MVVRQFSENLFSANCMRTEDFPTPELPIKINLISWSYYLIIIRFYLFIYYLSIFFNFLFFGRVIHEAFLFNNLLQNGVQFYYKSQRIFSLTFIKKQEIFLLSTSFSTYFNSSLQQQRTHNQDPILSSKQIKYRVNKVPSESYPIMFISQPSPLNKKNIQTQIVDDIKLVKNMENKKTRMSKRSSLISRPQQKMPISNGNSVQTIYTELQTYIRNLDQKIQNLLEKQSNEYKAVYQHHYNKFKEELQQLKQKTLEQEHQFLQNNHVHILQSQLKILKEEVKAYKTSYEQMKKENDQLKTAIEFYKQDLAFLENNVKNRIKEIKILTGENSKLESQLNRSSLNQTDQSKNQTQKSNDLKRRSHSMNIDDLSQPEIKIQFHKYNPNPVYKQLVSTKNLYEEYFFANQSTKESKTASNRPLMKKKSNQSFKGRIQYTHELSGSKEGRNLYTQESEKAEKNSKVFNICEWFLDCVETVRREIFHRKSELYSFQLDRMSNGFRHFHSLDGFLKIDKLQVIKLFLSSKEIITTIHHLLKNQKIFQVQDSKDKTFFNKTDNQNQECEIFDQDQDEDIEPQFTNLTIQESTNRKIKKKSMTDMGFFDWKLAQKAQKFQHLSQFSTTAAISRKKMYSSKSNQKKVKKTPEDRFNILLALNPKKNEEQKNIKMMKKITAIINKKKSMPLTSQLFARKRSFFIE